MPEEEQTVRNDCDLIDRIYQRLYAPDTKFEELGCEFGKIKALAHQLNESYGTWKGLQPEDDPANRGKGVRDLVNDTLEHVEEFLLGVAKLGKESELS